MTNLKTLAEAVKGWGNCTEAWLDTSEDDAAAVVGHIDEDGNTYPVMVIDCEQYYADHDSMKLAKFYAAANPNAVLHLITLIEAQAAQIEILKTAIKDALWDETWWRVRAKKVLETQPNEALQAFAEKVREYCAEICDEIGDCDNGYRCAKEIRAIKGLTK